MNFNNFLTQYKQKDATLLIIILALILFNPLTLFYIFYGMVVLDHKLTFDNIPYSFAEKLTMSTPFILWFLLILGWFGIIFRKVWAFYLTAIIFSFLVIFIAFSGGLETIMSGFLALLGL